LVQGLLGSNLVCEDSGDVALGPPEVGDRVLRGPPAFTDLFLPIAVRGALQRLIEPLLLGALSVIGVPSSMGNESSLTWE